MDESKSANMWWCHSRSFEVSANNAGAERHVAFRHDRGTDVQTLTRSMRLDLHGIDPAMARV
jgi:hypothetical protein